MAEDFSRSVAPLHQLKDEIAELKMENARLREALERIATKGQRGWERVVAREALGDYDDTD